MDPFSLYQRMREHGTLGETPGDVPDARFTLPSTINWMRALAILVKELKLDFASARDAYAQVRRRALSERELNSVCEQLLFALHQLAALRAIATVENKADVARIGIMAWYYGVYGAASAMIAASDGAFPDTHTATAQQWDRQFAAAGLALRPFGDRISDLLGDTVERDLTPVRERGKHSLTGTPMTLDQAWGCHAEYLAGTAKWEQRNVQQRTRDTREFKALGTDSFRTAAARSLRDQAYARRGIAFLHEAARYRGRPTTGTPSIWPTVARCRECSTASSKILRPPSAGLAQWRPAMCRGGSARTSGQRFSKTWRRSGPCRSRRRPSGADRTSGVQRRARMTAINTVSQRAECSYLHDSSLISI
jgi:hypothetical protein